MNVDVLAFSAHPDDAEIFAGGTLAWFSRHGYRIGLVHLTRGEAGTRGTPEQRLVEAQAAGLALGASHIEVLDLGDGRLSDSSIVRESIVRSLRSLRPNVILAPLDRDDHPDHAATGAAVKSAWYLSGIRKCAPAELESHRPQHLWFYPSHEIPLPRFVIPLTESDFEKKRAAILAYRSQFDETYLREPRTRISDPAFMKALEGRARYFGSLVQAAFGEPFNTTGPLAIHDPAMLFEGRR